MAKHGKHIVFALEQGEVVKIFPRLEARLNADEQIRMTHSIRKSYVVEVVDELLKFLGLEQVQSRWPMTGSAVTNLMMFNFRLWKAFSFFTE